MRRHFRFSYSIPDTWGEIVLAIFIFIIGAILILYYVNKLTHSLCIHKDIPEEHQQNVFRIINVLITILLISSYIEILYT